MSWKRSSFCSTDQATEQCVEVDMRDLYVFVRSSCDPSEEVAFTRDEWEAFKLGVIAGEFD
jgi:hypothetical protein